MCSSSPLCYHSSSCGTQGTQGCTKPWADGPAWGLPRVCGVQPSPCPACATGQPELFSSKHPHVRAGAAWLGPTSCQSFLAKPAVLQLQLARQLVPQPASKRAVQMAGSAPGASTAGERAAWDHTRLCERLGRDDLPPGRAGEPPEPPAPWPHWSFTVSSPSFGKGCSWACSLRLWVGSSAEGAELFSLPEVS